jgi:hypothetical protein
VPISYRSDFTSPPLGNRVEKVGGIACEVLETGDEELYHLR